MGWGGGESLVGRIYGGNALATVLSRDAIKVVTVRGTAFEKPAPGGVFSQPYNKGRLTIIITPRTKRTKNRHSERLIVFKIWSKVIAGTDKINEVY